MWKGIKCILYISHWYFTWKSFFHFIHETITIYILLLSLCLWLQFKQSTKDTHHKSTLPQVPNFPSVWWTIRSIPLLVLWTTNPMATAFPNPDIFLSDNNPTSLSSLQETLSSKFKCQKSGNYFVNIFSLKDHICGSVIYTVFGLISYGHETRV